MSSGDWRFVAAKDWDVLGWLFGEVVDAASLYRERTFGAKEDGRCECGKYVGAQHDGVLCDRCGVTVLADAAAARSTRLGHLRLACWCKHPVGGVVFEAFPVAPIARRTDGEG